jgi:hypothetical protein
MADDQDHDLIPANTLLRCEDCLCVYRTHYAAANDMRCMVRGTDGYVCPGRLSEPKGDLGAVLSAAWLAGGWDAVEQVLAAEPGAGWAVWGANWAHTRKP